MWQSSFETPRRWLNRFLSMLASRSTATFFVFIVVTLIDTVVVHNAIVAEICALLDDFHSDASCADLTADVCQPIHAPELVDAQCPQYAAANGELYDYVTLLQGSFGRGSEEDGFYVAALLVMDEKWFEFDAYQLPRLSFFVLCSLQLLRLSRAPTIQGFVMSALFLVACEQLVVYRLSSHWVTSVVEFSDQTPSWRRSNAPTMATSFLFQVLPGAVATELRLVLSVAVYALLARVFSFLHQPSSWHVLTGITGVGGRSTNYRVRLAVILTVPLLIVGIFSEKSEVLTTPAIPYAFCVLLVDVVLLQLSFAVPTYRDERRMTQTMDLCWEQYVRLARGRGGGYFSSADLLRADVMATLLCLPNITVVLCSTSLVVLVACGSLPVHWIGLHGLLLFVFIPHPEMHPPLGEYLPTVEDVVQARLQYLTLAPSTAVAPLSPLFNRGMYVRWQRWIVSLSLPSVLSSRWLPGSTRRDSGAASSRATKETMETEHRAMERNLAQFSHLLLYPSVAHLLPTDGILQMLHHSLSLHPFGLLARGSDGAALKAVHHAVSQASDYFAIRSKLLFHPGFSHLQLRLATQLLLQKDRGTVEVPGGSERTLVPVAPANEITQPVHVVVQHLECCCYVFAIATAILRNRSSSDPHDAAVVDCALSERPLRDMTRMLPQLLELVIWSEGPGEAYAPRGLVAEVVGDAIRIPTAVPTTPLRAVWMQLRGILAEYAAALVRNWLHLTHIIHGSAPGAERWDRGLTVTVVAQSSSGDERREYSLSEWLTPERRKELFVRVSYVVHKHFFRSQMSITVAGHYFHLLALLWSAPRIGNSASLRYAALENLGGLCYQEDPATHGLALRSAGGSVNAAQAALSAAVPEALQTCNGKPILFFCALVCLKASADMLETNGLHLLARNTLRAATQHAASQRLAEFMELFARHRVSYCATGMVAYLAKLLGKLTVGMHELRTQIRISFFSPQNYAGDVGFLEDFYRGQCSAEVSLGNAMASIVRALHEYSQFPVGSIDPAVYRIEMTSLMQSLPLANDIVERLIVDEGVLLPAALPSASVSALGPGMAANGGPASSALETFTFRLHAAEVARWSQQFIQQWGSGKARFQSDLHAARTQSKRLTCHVMSFFEFPPSMQRIRVNVHLDAFEHSNLAHAECVICLDELGSTPGHDDVELLGMDGVVKLNACSHCFHAACVFRLLCGGHTKCPVCRSTM